MDSSAVSFLNLLTGRRLESLCCECKVLDCGFSGLHAMGLSRIVLNGDIPVTTMDFQSRDGQIGKNNDEWHNAERFRSRIIAGRVLSVDVNELNGLTVRMGSGAVIGCLTANSCPHYGEEREQRLPFEQNKDGMGRALTVYGKHAEYAQ